MEEKQFLEILVKRYVDNALDQEELEAFFFLLKQGKLDGILDKYLDQEKDEILSKKIANHNFGGVSIFQSSVRVAASFVLLLAIGAAAYFNQNKFYSLIGKSYLITVETGKNEKQLVKLSDGSVLWVNESSKIRYASIFDQKLRRVELLEGEAYFDVKRDETRPFLVEAAGTTTKVLGTAFNIRSYSYLQNLQVTVTRGKVAVEEPSSNDSKKVTKILLPNEQANVDLKTKEIRKVIVNSANAVAWKEGRLLFDNERFEDIVTILENKFDVQIDFSDLSIKDYHISAEFISSDSLDHVLDLLSMANNLNYKIDNDKVTISKKQKSINSSLPM